MGILLDGVLVALTAYYLVLAPYSKIEESFNTQAVHDLLFYGLDFSLYDNTAYEAVVPRTFWGSLVISGLTRFMMLITSVPNRFWLQYMSRGMLAALNLRALFRFRSAVAGRDPLIGNLFTFFVLGQFHIVFYAGRMLPNMMAMPLVLESFTLILKSWIRTGLLVLAIATLVFRGELVALEVPIAFALVALRQLSLKDMVVTGIQGVLTGSALTVGVDSLFWSRWTYPEVEAFVFNVVDGKASDWGVEPWWTYILKHLPNLLANPLLMILAASAMFTTNQRRIQALGLGTIGFLILYSLQPHKELRFIIYVVPIWTALASVKSAQFWRSKCLYRRALVAATVFCGLGAICISLLKAHVSAMNYPGGEAVALFHGLTPWEEANGKTVHIDVLSFRTGHTRFGEEWRDNGVNYHRTEDENISIEHLWDTFDYYIGEMPLEALGGGPWEQIGAAEALDHIEKRPLISFIRSALRGHIGDVNQLLRETFVVAPEIFLYRRILPDEAIRDVEGSARLSV